MSITIEQGFSVSVALIVTDGSLPSLDETTLPTSGPTSGNPSSVRVVYPDPTPGVANPARSMRLDALGGSGANVTYTCLGHNGATLVTVTPAVNRGAASFGPVSAPFPTPAA